MDFESLFSPFLGEIVIFSFFALLVGALTSSKAFSKEKGSKGFLLFVTFSCGFTGFFFVAGDAIEIYFFSLKSEFGLASKFFLAFLEFDSGYNCFRVIDNLEFTVFFLT